MFIVNKQRDDTYNLQHIVNIYIGSDGCTIKASAGTATRGGVLGRYNSYSETQKAFSMLTEGIGKGEMVFQMPDDEEVKKTFKNEKYHHVTGKKTKGHGAS